MATVEFDVVCDNCKKPLDVSWEMRKYDDLVLRVEPCETCLEKAKVEGEEEGKKEGDEEGYERGLEHGKGET